MGFFNKTEEELRIEKERKELKELKETLKSNKELALDQQGLNKLLEYIDEVMAGKKNGFFENDFLIRAFLNFKSPLDLYFTQIVIKDLLLSGKDTANYEFIKEMIINDFLGENGYLNKSIYNRDLYYMFEKPENFSRIMRTIQGNEVAIKNFDKLVNYITKAIKYSIDEETSVKSLISTITNLDESVLNIDDYLNNELDKDKKRAGEYAVSHEDIMTAASTMRRIDSQIEKLDNLIFILDEKGKDINRSTNEGINKLTQTKGQLVNELKTYKDSLERELKHLLENHLENIKVEINNKADTVFSEILKKYQDQLDEFRRVSENLSSQSARDLATLKRETDNSLNQLREYVKNNPELKSALSTAEESAVVRDKILKIIEKEQTEQLDVLPEVIESKRVKGISRVVVKDTPKITIPDSVVTSDVQIIKPYSYKNAKEFANRMRAIERVIAEGTSNGEIYHDKIKEVIACLMVGDWPYLFGPSGAGKGYMVEQIGDLLGQKVLDAGKITEPHSIFGYIDPQGQFRATSTFEAVTNGDIIFFDEFDNGNPDTAVALNTLYSNLRDKVRRPEKDKYVKFAGEIDVPINPNTRMIAAGNTDGSGSDRQFNERGKIDESIMERYKPIYIAYDNRVEEKILKDYQSWYNFFIKFREYCEEYANRQGEENAQGNASTRDASDILRDVTLNAKTMTEMMNQYFVQIKEADYREAVARRFAEAYNLNKDEDYPDYKGKLGDANEQELAKQFIKRSRKGIKG